MKPQFDITPDEWICLCIARQVVDGEFLAQGLATPMVTAGYLLAWHTHAPNAYFASAIGQSVCREGASIGLASIEALWLDKAMNTYGFVQAGADLLPAIRPKEFFRFYPALDITLIESGGRARVTWYLILGNLISIVGVCD